MENGVIKLSLGDWLWNASVAGFLNIVGERDVRFSDNTAKVSDSCLENFEEKYFSYFINTYEQNLPWFKLISFHKTIKYYQETEFKTLSLQNVKDINLYIKDIAKKFTNQNSFKAAFELMGDAEDVENLGKALQRITEPKDETAFEVSRYAIIKQIEKQFEVLDKIIEYCSSENGRRFIGAKNVIYSIIKNGWNGVSFLNPQTKEKDIYTDYKKYFVDEAKAYLKEDKQKYKLRCFTCEAPIKNLNNDMSFINQSGFDVSRKPSHVWNFQNDIAICPVCKLIYSCLPAGFVYVGNSGLYINANLNMAYNQTINSNVKKSILAKGENELSSRKIYRTLLEALISQKIVRSKYELADVQVVRYENGSYRFNLLPETTISLIEIHQDELNRLIRTGYREGNESYSIYEQVLEQVFNNQNLFLFINKLLHYKLSSPGNCFFHGGHIADILKVNVRLIQNLGGMENMEKERDYLKEAAASGYGLRKAYLGKDPKTRKISGVSYRLLNALKTNNRGMFMDVILNCYLYVGKEVPAVIPEVMRNDDEVFSTIGYAFVSSFIDGKPEEKSIVENGEEIEQ
jgi:CRISPR-associated protein Cst1